MASSARDGTRHGACARSLRLIVLHEGAPAAGGRHQPRQPDVDGGDDCRLSTASVAKFTNAITTKMAQAVEPIQQ